MRKTTKTLSLLLGVLLFAPSLALGQDTGGTVTVSSSASVENGDASAGAKGSGTVSTGVTGNGKKMPPKPIMLRESPTRGVMTARESATGKATGRLNALPPGIPTTDTRMRIMGTATTTPERMEMRQQMQERRSEIVKHMAGMMVNRMKAAVERLTKIALRMDSRIAKLKARGVDTAKAEANIVIARTKMAEASADITVAETAIGDAVLSADATGTSTAPKDPAKSVREPLIKAKEAVFAAHKALVDAIASISAGVSVNGNTEVNGSSTVTQ